MRRLALLAAAAGVALVAPGWLAPTAAQLVGRHDGGAPIEITAENLTVRQNENLAIFTGDVDAVQGDTSLKADELRVFYAEGGTGQPGTGGNQNVRRIEAIGNVLLARPDESASGERGDYDVPAGKVTMTGNVVLTNKGNVIRGGRLDYDLNTGVAVLTPAGPTADARGQRVRALFQSQPRQER